ncbi:Os01g0350500, partial [Oryza sativa Japonica Group]
LVLIIYALFFEGENLRKRRYYSDELKIAIYLVLLAKADPPVLHRGVSKQVALKFGVPLRLVQHVWQNGKEKGCVDGVVNKLFKNVGRKRIEIDLEAIRDVPSGERATLRRLADALGVKKTTLHNRLKEVKFRWR